MKELSLKLSERMFAVDLDGVSSNGQVYFEVIERLGESCGNLAIDIEMLMLLDRLEEQQ